MSSTSPPWSSALAAPLLSPRSADPPAPVEPPRFLGSPSQSESAGASTAASPLVVDRPQGAVPAASLLLSGLASIGPPPPRSPWTTPASRSPEQNGRDATPVVMWSPLDASVADADTPHTKTGTPKLRTARGSYDPSPLRRLDSRAYSEEGALLSCVSL
ncbi:unnamed protein product [Polarella glacialis]|uniref:Uncharacterized protein n=1 Tax=Polarella glacialis TaxID=89957 RepID=A0A813DG72_POLGL|nr:unnamed protein product [Polarella glacialis]CAE8587859.1 unnamed protein product [Polarella glacialis]